MYFLAKYNTQTVIYFPMVKRAVVDLAVTADWTPAAADTNLSKDGGAQAQATNTVAISTGTTWKLTVTATELQAAEVQIMIVDAATKAVEDQWITIYTYGNASAKFVADITLANLPANVTQLLGTAWLTPATAGTPDVNAKLLGGTTQTGVDVGGNRAEPAQGAPAASTSLAAKIDYLYKAWRNRHTQTSTTFSLMNDDAVTVDHKATVSDNGTTFDRTEIASGP